MSLKISDPLLSTVRLAIGFFVSVFAIAAGALAIGLPVLLAAHSRITAELVERGMPPTSTMVIAGAMALAGGLMVLGFFFFRHLYRIIGTVGEGDPFVPVNAVRLRAMAWISLATHLVAVPLAILGRWLESASEHAQVRADIPASGLLLALILFILARVFREGTRMRDELEGTV